ncbi:exonuclease V, chloroplastic-like [Lotus japonicus]|uniref:exonuclease V, chloroplastic-like n=1 Tax=Lotus japonicus TaxID=34305 RepID=UPI00258A32BA|nr:exonuclease V, chloroplastic-like [Lotus japonicus]
MAETSSDHTPHIPIEIITDDEMALIEAAFAFASASARSAFRSSTPPPPPPPLSPPSSSSPLFRSNALSIKSITVLSKRSFSHATGSGTSTHHPDIEDSSPKLKTLLPDSFLHRFRKNRGLSVTDITSTEWCSKQMEFALTLGGRKTNQVMRAGIARHAKLEEEVIKRVEVNIKSKEDQWALKFLNFINGVNQLFFEGLTRELPIMGFAEDTWIVGVIDEIRMPSTENDHNPILIDTKTRARDTLPSEPQRRNGRLQLMCYKYLWDSLVADDFPSEKFFTKFGLYPEQTLCEDLKVKSSDPKYSALTLDDVVRYYKNTCSMLLPAHDQLLLRYEYQKDHSLIGEDKFAYDSEWLKSQMHRCIEVWLGKRETTYVPEEENWKCRFCQFATVCDASTDSKGTMANTSNDSNAKQG